MARQWLTHPHDRTGSGRGETDARQHRLQLDRLLFHERRRAMG